MILGVHCTSPFPPSKWLTRQDLGLRVKVQPPFPIWTYCYKSTRFFRHGRTSRNKPISFQRVVLVTGGLSVTRMKDFKEVPTKNSVTDCSYFNLSSPGKDYSGTTQLTPESKKTHRTLMPLSPPPFPPHGFILTSRQTWPLLAYLRLICRLVQVLHLFTSCIRNLVKNKSKKSNWGHYKFVGPKGYSSKFLTIFRSVTQRPLNPMENVKSIYIKIDVNHFYPIVT